MTRRWLLLLVVAVATCAPDAGAQVTYETMHALCPPIERICGPTPTPSPTRTPRFTPTPVRPTPTQSPSLAQRCPDGQLTGITSRTNKNWFGFDGVEVRPGQTKRFCAMVMPPQIPANTIPNSLSFTWYDVTDQDCGALSVKVDAVDPPPRHLGEQQFGKGFSSSGALHLYSNAGHKYTPEAVRQGVYVVTVFGGPSSCTHFDIAWHWE